MNYKHLTLIERYLIWRVMKAQHNITQIIQLLERYKTTLSNVLQSKAKCRGNRAKQACKLIGGFESSNSNITHAFYVKEQPRKLFEAAMKYKANRRWTTSNQSINIICIFTWIRRVWVRFRRTCFVKNKKNRAASVRYCPEKNPTAGRCASERRTLIKACKLIIENATSRLDLCINRTSSRKKIKKWKFCHSKVFKKDGRIGRLSEY